MAILLDVNVLVALIVTDHVHHRAAESWLAGTAVNFATCPITQGGLVRLLIRQGQSAGRAQSVITGLRGAVRHEFWPDSVSFTDVAMDGVVGRRQVTGAYLAQSERRKALLRAGQDLSVSAARATSRARTRSGRSSMTKWPASTASKV